MVILGIWPSLIFRPLVIFFKKKPRVTQIFGVEQFPAKEINLYLVRYMHIQRRS
uniref:Uncharacterized protein n=1 Tax=Arundo donax TaxID=35708 RepID=A0A0A9AKF7_ARUDO